MLKINTFNIFVVFLSHLVSFLFEILGSVHYVVNFFALDFPTRIFAQYERLRERQYSVRLQDFLPNIPPEKVSIEPWILASSQRTEGKLSSSPSLYFSVVISLLCACCQCQIKSIALKCHTINRIAPQKGRMRFRELDQCHS